MEKNIAIYQIALRSLCQEGTLASATELLPFIKGNGFDIVYICPAFKQDDDEDRITWSPRQKKSECNNPKNPYKIIDYYNIDEEYGTNEDLKFFVEKAHSIGLKVMLDLVFLHCGRNAVFIEEHPDWVEQDESGRPMIAETWPFARINYSSEGVREYLWRNMETWIRDYGVDGFRCDVGDAVPLDFWREGKRRIKCINPEVILLNEGCDPEFVKDVFDLNYFNSLSYQVAFIDDENKEKILSEKLDELRSNGVWDKCINFYENHDVASDTEDKRLDKVYGCDVVNLILCLMYTWIGVPMLFNGNEICDTALQCMFSNRFYGRKAGIDWSNLLREDGIKRLELVRRLNALRKSHPGFYSDQIELIKTNIQNCIAFIKKSEKETLLVFLNFSDNIIELDYKVKGMPLVEYNCKIGRSKIRLGKLGYIICNI